jgi:hypothetical protein
MARRATLSKLLNDLRAEARLSLAPAHNVQVAESHKIILQRIQERLWEEFTWPHLRVERFTPIQEGQRYFDTPPDMQIDRIERIEVFAEGEWIKLRSGIDARDYRFTNSDIDDRDWPPRAWKIHEDEDLEIWPIPNQDADTTTREGFLRFTGIRNLKPLVADGDRADLDDRMLVLYAAGEILGAAGAKDAQLKLDQANAIYARLKSNLTPSTKFKMFGVGSNDAPRRPHIFIYRPRG